MAKNVKRDLARSRDINYLNKDFNNFRSDLESYARVHFSEVIGDFGEASLGGMFLDMAAYVGDVMSFYLDHQFSELSLETATEEENIEQLVRDAGVNIRGASPSLCELEIILTVSAVVENGVFKPNNSQLPIVKLGSQFKSLDGIVFESVEDVNFAEKDKFGNLKADVVIDAVDTSNNPTTYLVKRSVLVSSGQTTTENFTVTTFVPFRTLTLANADVSEIISVKDLELNAYYQVESLAHDIIFQANENIDNDQDKSEFSLNLEPAARRFIADTDYQTGQTFIRFGSGISEYDDEDVIEDPTDFALPLFGERTNFKIDAVDPGNLLESNTLGIAPQNTTLTVRYRYGGGLSHNVSARTITNISSIDLQFPVTTSDIVQNAVRNSAIVSNPRKAKGGESRPTLEELRNIAFSARSAQSRIVNVQDLLYRIYTMPTKFGRIYRAGVSKNPISNSILIHVVVRNKNQQLEIANDTLKDNVAIYVNEYRLVSDSYDIVDAQIINLGLEYIISPEKGFNSSDVISRCNNNIISYLDTKNMHIDKPIVITDIMNIVINTEGVLSLAGLRFVHKAGTEGSAIYSNSIFNVLENTRRQQLFPPPGGIFEVKFPDSDIKGAVL